MLAPEREKKGADPLSPLEATEDRVLSHLMTGGATKMAISLLCTSVIRNSNQSRDP